MHERHGRAAVAAAGLVVVVGLAPLAQGKVVVGVLENSPCEQAGTVAVRALFTKAGNDWVALDGREIFARTIAPEMTWTVTLDGSSLGTIRTHDARHDVERSWMINIRKHVLELAPGQRPPRRANPGHRFDGWCEPVPDRPLVVYN